MFAVKPVILVSNKGDNYLFFFSFGVDKTLAEMLCSHLCPNCFESNPAALIHKDNSINVYVNMINIKYFAAPGEDACSMSVTD